MLLGIRRRVAVSLRHHRPARGFGGWSSSPSAVQTYEMKRVLSSPPDHVYLAVSDVNSYSSFVPYCIDSRITDYNPSGVPTRALIGVGWGQFAEEFESSLTFGENTVIAQASGSDLFRELFTEWKVLSLSGKPNKCLVDFTLRYEFRNQLYNSASGMFAPKLASIMVKAFSERAAYLTAQSSL